MRNASDKIFRENKKKLILCSIKYFPHKSRAVDEKMWEEMIELDRPQMAMKVECGA